MNKKILKYVSQSVLGMIGVSVYILADTYFISYGFGADGLTVLNLILPIYGLIYAIGQMLGLGFAVSYAYYAVPGLRLYFTGFLIAGVNVYLIAYYSATGREKPVMIGSILRGMVLIAGFAVLFGFLFGMNGIWLSYLAAEAGTLLVLLMMQRVSRDAL